MTNRSDIQYSIHHAIGKNTNNTNLARDWKTRSSSDIDAAIYYLTSEGRAFSWATFEDGYRRGANITRVDGVGLDFDNTGNVPYLTWQDAQADPILGGAWLAYPSPSFKPTHHKYRLLFLLPEPVTTKDGVKEVRHLLLQLMDLYPQVDKACKDPGRLWYGTPNSNPLFENRADGVVDVSLITAAHAQWVIDNPKRAKDSLSLSFNTHLDVDANENDMYCPAFDGFFRDDIGLARRIMQDRLINPFEGRGSNTYQDARPFLYACVCWLGAAVTAELVQETGWEWEDYDVYQQIEKIIDEVEVETKLPTVIWNGMLKWRVKSDDCKLTWNHVNQHQRGGIRYV